MLSFKEKLQESQVSPYSLGNILRVTNSEESYRALVVSSKPHQALLLVLTGEKTGDLVSSESLQDYDISIVSEMEGRLPETRYFFKSLLQSATSSPLNIIIRNCRKIFIREISLSGGTEHAAYARQRRPMSA